jgi:hypothetical protein
VNSNGYVGINKSNPAYNLDWFGTGRYWATWGQLIFDSSGYNGVATIHPYEDWIGCLGRSDKRFNILYVDHVITRAVTYTSDETLKTNIRNLNGSLNDVLKIRGVKYDFKSDFFKVDNPKIQKELEENTKNEIGFLAQEIIEVFPEMVFLDSTNNQYSVDYIQLIPVLVEAIKEQQDIIDDLVARIETMEEDCCNNTLKRASLATGTHTRPAGNEAILYQNTPNPFREQTEIKCYLPEGTVSSTLYIFNIQGLQLEEHKIHGTGDQLVRINGNRFKPGMYLYSLVVNGREIDTKRMILTK